ncbi:MAG: hypothetical protein FD145_1257 [Candidatus Saganbacteria bacterium]|uniref:Methyltransferase type 11 domain-containing protein n=1 Tax=Candidatus Saganbacteria bacterium TaxID=2575572 RepID=A0A833L2Z1_UNCSA|nr:MAG: hypothetical protein FD145_1257 [Candidatus Saganbacteria bacterium]
MINKTNWDNAAEWYNELVSDEGSDYQKNVIFPNAIRLLSIEKEEKLIDIACGQGVFSRILAKSGAEVFGLDASFEMIKFAKERSKGIKNLKFFNGDARNLKQFNDNYFDVAVCVLALQNIDPIENVISSTSRILKDGGKFLLVINHPCFRVPKRSEWGIDEKKKIQYRRIDKYLSSFNMPIKMHPGYDPSEITWTFHRPLSKYVELLGENKLAVIKLEEWISHRKSKPGKRKREEDMARNEIPLFLAVLAKKIK